jgi:hypothetical protein
VHALFSPAELDALRAEDKLAATMIVALMTGIFVVGLVLYTFVCIWVAS